MLIKISSSFVLSSLNGSDAKVMGILVNAKCGKGLTDRLISNLPFELHLPGYQYCGPGTNLIKRLARGDRGINPLDAACKEHDIAYSKNRENLAARHEADKVLAAKAWKRVLDRDSNLGEKAAAWGVANTMKAKVKFGMGHKMKKDMVKRKKKNGKTARKKKILKKKPVILSTIIKAAKSSMPRCNNAQEVISSALKGAREAVQKAGGKSMIKTPRILPVPFKVGGFLPFLIPLFAGLSATGALAGGAAGIAKAVNDANKAKEQLAESKRHNRVIEQAAISVGHGLHLKPYKNGLGLYLKPAKNL